jgi:squalene-hopene/tetraprenyl-beta-curcumene cyclase
VVVNEPGAGDAPTRAMQVAAREALLQQRTPLGRWEGHLSSSALSTATAVVAIALFMRDSPEPSATDVALLRRGIDWLIEHQNADGGWGDTDRSVSNISTTLLGWAALACASKTKAGAEAEGRAEAWLTNLVGSLDRQTLARAVIARYGKDRTFSVPILTACALAGRLGDGPEAWRVIPQLPFELALLPRWLFPMLALQVVSYALPALIALGLARHHHRRSRNPLTRTIRNIAVRRSLRVLALLQPTNGGFLEAIPLTSFVTMSLVGAREADHAVVRRAIHFLRQSVRDDGSWPIDTNLATWVTTLSVQALNAGGRIGQHLDGPSRASLRVWLLSQQTRRTHAYTGAAAGAWSWTHLPGGVPDADDTSGVLLALRALDPDEETRRAAAGGVEWLLDLQNRDGGMPTFCRGWGALPFDRSGADLTAHAIRAWVAWRSDLDPPLQRRIDSALEAALRYLTRQQRPDGAFLPLWFGNQHAPNDSNPTYGTSRVLLALSAAREWTRFPVETPMRRGVEWLLRARNTDGGWGGDQGTPSSIEETALALSALAVFPGDPWAQAAARTGMEWIARMTTGCTVFPPSPLGLYFAKLWYYERLYPIVWATEALERSRCRD